MKKVNNNVKSNTHAVMIKAVDTRTNRSQFIVSICTVAAVS